MGNGQIQSFVPASKMIAPFAGSKIRGNQYAFGFGGVSFWLDAAYGVNTFTDLGAVSYWIDKIKGMSFAQVTAGNQPRYLSSDSNFNNLPSIDMAWSSGRTLTHAVGIASKGTFCVVIRAGTIDNKLFLFGNSGTTNQQMFNGGNASVNITGFGIYNNLTAVMKTTVEDTLPHIIVITGTEIVIDGVQAVTGTWDQTVTYDIIGSTTVRGNAIAEIIKFDRQLSSAQCLQLSSNLNAKYLIY